jgi:hypothetical protein
LNGIKKEFQIAGKGQNETLEIAILMKHTCAATNSVDSHAPENGGTCQFTKLCQSVEECVIGFAIDVKRRRNQLEQVTIIVVNHALAKT